MTMLPRAGTAPADILALDFETADRKHSACSAGFVAVRNGEVFHEEEILIDPGVAFDPHTTAVHGLDASSVAGAPPYPYFHKVFSELVGPKTIIVAHNASFDLGVVRKSCDRYGLTYPTATYLCTLKLAEAHFTHVPRCTLDNLARHLGFPLNHHNALEDARACLGVYQSVEADLMEQGLTVKDFLHSRAMKMGSIFPRGYQPFKGGGKSYTLPPAPAVPGPLTGKTFCVLGEPVRYTPAQLRKILEDRGAVLAPYFAPNVDYLIVGKKGFFDTEDDVKTVVNEAKALNAAGNLTRIMSEAAFVERLTEVLQAELLAR